MNLTSKKVQKAVLTASNHLLKPDAYADKLSPLNALKRMGFGRSQNVLDYEDYKTAFPKAQYYKERYPQFNFITAHQLGKIKAKYDLEQNQVSQFKGVIPGKSLYELIDAEIYAGDINMTYPKKKEAWGLTDNRIDQLVSIMSDPNGSQEELNKLFEKPEEFPLSDKRPTDRVDVEYINNTFPNALIIVGPSEVFSHPTDQADFIVAVAVHGGLLVITSWGDKASEAHIND